MPLCPQYRPASLRLGDLDGKYELRLTIRLRYYLLVAACVLARKAEWLRNACLAAALILPAVAAIHGVVLATLHFPGSSTQSPNLSMHHPHHALPL